MAKKPMKDVVVLLPGITGSVLQKDGKDIWAVNGGAAVRALLSLGRNLNQLTLVDDDPDVDDLGDGVVATKVMPDIGIIPGLWKIDGYGKVSKTIRESFDVTPGENFFEFPYDWRRDNRAAARKLARQSHDWLKDWRDKSGNADAKLILVGHSMGGLVSRYFLEVLEGWKDTRFLITFGTPYRGSMSALSFISHGMKKGVGPITLIDLSNLLRSLTSVYQLLPIYPCVDTGPGDLLRVTEASGIPELDTDRALAAFEFHHAISDAVEQNSHSAQYNEHGYQIQPLVGIFQPTSQSAKLTNGKLGFYRSYEGVDMGGDGTVPRVSATPIELSNKNVEVYIKDKHASLQNSDHSLEQLIGVLSSTAIDQAIFFSPTSGLSLDIEDLYGTSEEIVIRALPEVEWAELAVDVIDTTTGNSVASAGLVSGSDGWHETTLAPLAEGSYRVTVTGQGDIDPVSDVMLVVGEEEEPA